MQAGIYQAASRVVYSEVYQETKGRLIVGMILMSLQDASDADLHSKLP